MKILSSLPGRLRVSHPRMKCHFALDEMLISLKECVGITQVEGQAITGSILIHYDNEVLKEKELLQRAFSSFKVSYGSPAPKLKKRKGFRLHKSNRLWRTSLHGGMLGSLAVCTYTGFKGPKKLHVKSGLAFLAITAEHMRINRKLLFR